MAGTASTLMAAAALAFEPAPAALPAGADPAIWAVHDQDTTVYLFGTFHALDGRSNWFKDKVRTAFAHSDELVLETLLPQVTPRPAPSHSRLGVAPSASFLGATRMAVAAGRDRGLDVHHGADMVLRRAADSSGKPVQGLETFQFQLRMMRQMTGPPSPSGPPATVDDSSRRQLAEIMTDMQSAWERGDQRMFAGMLSQMRFSAPQNYRAMFPERNARWADWIVDRMARPGVVFVAVGAAHFAGPDSVLANLNAQGFTPTRLN